MKWHWIKRGNTTSGKVNNVWKKTWQTKSPSYVTIGVF